MATVVESPALPQSIEADGLYEVVGGRVVEKPAMGAYEVELAFLLAEFLSAHARANRLGRVSTEMLFRIDTVRGLERRPDVAFVSLERWPLERRAPRTAAWDVVPDLAVEVISPNNRSNDDREKLEEYFRAGVKAVWFIYPALAKVDVYDSPTSVTIRALGDTLEGGTLLPGFALPLASLFGVPEETAPTSTT